MPIQVLLCSQCPHLDKVKCRCRLYDAPLERYGYLDFYKCFACNNPGSVNESNKDTL
jgi:hypothetical protein